MKNNAKNIEIMETKTLTSGTISITMFLRIIVLMVLLTITSVSFGQMLKEEESFAFDNHTDMEYELTSFVCKSLNGKVYVMWTVKESTNNCVYKLERSEDGKNYTTIYSVIGSKSPNSRELLNSFIDEHPLSSEAFYRIKRVTQENNIYSSTYTVNGINITSDISSVELYTETVAASSVYVLKSK